MVLPFIDQKKNKIFLSKNLSKFRNILVLDEGTYGGVASFISRIILDSNISN